MESHLDEQKYHSHLPLRSFTDESPHLNDDSSKFRSAWASQQKVKRPRQIIRRGDCEWKSSELMVLMFPKETKKLIWIELNCPFLNINIKFLHESSPWLSRLCWLPFFYNFIKFQSNFYVGRARGSGLSNQRSQNYRRSKWEKIFC